MAGVKLFSLLRYTPLVPKMRQFSVLVHTADIIEKKGGEREGRGEREGFIRKKKKEKKGKEGKEGKGKRKGERGRGTGGKKKKGRGEKGGGGVNSW